MHLRTILPTIWCLLGQCAQAQVPLVPSWTQLGGTGSGGTSKVAWDAVTQKILWGYSEQNYDQPLRQFDLAGTDMTPEPQLILPSVDNAPDAHSILRKLAAHDDTLDVINYFSDETLDQTNTITTGLAMALTGGALRAKNLRNSAVTDLVRDSVGSVMVLGTSIRTLAASGWPQGSVTVPISDRIAMSLDRIYCGQPPNFTVLDRATLTLLSPLTVPMSGTPTQTFLILQGDVLYYAVRTVANYLHQGAVNLNGALMWSTSIHLLSGSHITGFVIDAAGSSWVSTGEFGRLYGTNATGTLADMRTFGATIDDIATDGSHLILTGKDQDNASLAYLAVFDAPLVTGVRSLNSTTMTLTPNPARDLVTLQGLPIDVTGIKLIDATGRSLKELTGPFTSTLNLSVTDLAPGSYFFHISGPAEKSTLPFQVAR
ncbi:MAG: T9SS type A sorting domain-containing protein [Flavobacteriales bacterium]